VRLLEDGSVTVNTGTVDLGQGADTVLAQICAESLKLPLQHVNVAQPDTDGSPYNWSTGGSRSTYMAGRAVAKAADGVRKEILAHAAKMMECSPADLELRSGGNVGVKGADVHVTFRAVIQRAHWVANGPIIGSAAIMYEGGGFDPKRTG
jgi:CO/xanthine dehydrogenase Mo-binding subunit